MTVKHLPQHKINKLDCESKELLVLELIKKDYMYDKQPQIVLDCMVKFQQLYEQDTSNLTIQEMDEYLEELVLTRNIILKRYIVDKF